jgi:spore coat protein U-like protein
MAMPVNIAISCSGTPFASCGSSIPVSYTYDMTYSGSTMNLDSGANHLTSRICSTASLTNSICSAIQYKGSSAGGATMGTINGSYNFVPNVGRTDNYTAYIIVKAAPTAAVGSYSTGSFTNHLTVGSYNGYDSVTINMNVVTSCTVSASALNFGTYTSSSASDVNTTVSVLCSFGTAYNVGLDAGLGAGATVANRKVTSGANLLNYSLYQDAARTVVWGNTNGSNTLSGTGSGVTQALTVYGRVFSGQSAALGNYQDTITVTVYF